MRRSLVAAMLGLASFVATASGFEVKSKPPVVNDKKEEGCAGHGTSVDFYDTPSEAATRAKKQQKLVFVLHVSGNFEDPRFT